MIIKRTVRFRFKDSTERIFSISIDDPKEDLKKQDILQFTNFVVENDIFRPYGNLVSGLVDAELVTVSRSTVE